MSASAKPTPGGPPHPVDPDAPVDWRIIVCFGAMVVGQFMSILDIQIVSASITKVQAGLAASREEISWIQTSYLIAEVIMLPLSGFLARWLSTRVVFCASAMGFTAASIWAGMATSMPELIMARVAQGFIGGAMTPMVFATAFTVLPERLRNRALAMVGLIIPLAPTLGPTFGGYLTEALSWRWLFYINVVPGIAITLIVWRWGKFDRGDPNLAKGFDFPGLVFMAMFLGGLEYVLEEGPRHDWFDEPWTLRVFIATVIGGILFFWRSLTYHNPIVELRAFRDRNFFAGCVINTFLGMGLFGATFLVPLYLAQVRNLDAMQIGIVMSVAGAVMLPMAPVSGWLLGVIDHRVQIAIGASIACLGFYTAGGITKEWDFWELALPQALRSIGLSLVFPPLTRLALSTLEPALMKSGSSIFNLTRQLGGAIGLALLNFLLLDRIQFHWQRIAESVNPAKPGMQAYIDQLRERAGSMVGMDPDAFAARRLGGLVAREALVMSFADAFLAVACAFLVMAALQLVVRRPRIASAPARAPSRATATAAKGP
jgi:DHA2 family multidrug resistance protein